MRDAYWYSLTHAHTHEWDQGKMAKLATFQTHICVNVTFPNSTPLYSQDVHQQHTACVILFLKSSCLDDRPAGDTMWSRCWLQSSHTNTNTITPGSAWLSFAFFLRMSSWLGVSHSYPIFWRWVINIFAKMVPDFEWWLLWVFVPRALPPVFQTFGLCWRDAIFKCCRQCRQTTLRISPHFSPQAIVQSHLRLGRNTLNRVGLKQRSFNQNPQILGWDARL